MPPGMNGAAQTEQTPGFASGPASGLASAGGGTTAELVSLYFDEVRALAAAQMRGERVEHTLQPTALANEAFLRLSWQTGGTGEAGQAGESGGSAEAWRDKSHFLFAASVAIRRILIDHARGRGSTKRGGKVRRVPLEEGRIADGMGGAAADPEGLDLIGLDEVLAELRQRHPRQAAVVEMRFFGGLTEARIALVLGVTERTVRSDWAFARAWLHRRLRTGDGG